MPFCSSKNYFFHCFWTQFSNIRACPSVRVKIIFQSLQHPIFEYKGMPLYSKIGYCPYKRKHIFLSLFGTQFSYIRACPYTRKLDTALMNKKNIFSSLFGTQFLDIRVYPYIRNLDTALMNKNCFFFISLWFTIFGYKGMPFYSKIGCPYMRKMGAFICEK